MNLEGSIPAAIRPMQKITAPTTIIMPESTGSEGAITTPIAKKISPNTIPKSAIQNSSQILLRATA